MLLTATLSAHPSTPNSAVRALDIAVRVQRPGILAFHYVLRADMARIRIPLPSGKGARINSLWEHTCFEAFVATGAAASYHEFNFSPSLNWATYRFGDYRQARSIPEIDHAPEISVQRSEQQLELASRISVQHLPELSNTRYLRFAPAAIIEDEAGDLSYWAIRHPPGVPDFHLLMDPNSRSWALQWGDK
jgi:hypothetical protein